MLGLSTYGYCLSDNVLSLDELPLPFLPVEVNHQERRSRKNSRKPMRLSLISVYYYDARRQRKSRVKR
eukprot:1386243-Amorphochlora_amoeboformis.AAC.1